MVHCYSKKPVVGLCRKRLNQGFVKIQGRIRSILSASDHFQKLLSVPMRRFIFFVRQTIRQPVCGLSSRLRLYARRRIAEAGIPGCLHSNRQGAARSAPVALSAPAFRKATNDSQSSSLVSITSSYGLPTPRFRGHNFASSILSKAALCFAFSAFYPPPAST